MSGTSPLPPFEDLLEGRGCPMCRPQRKDVNEFWMKVADLSISSLYLERNQTNRGYCILAFNPRHVNGIEHLPLDEHMAFMADLKKAADAVFAAVSPDHMNYATLGNVIPHLHIHIIPRYKGEERWGAPVWTSSLKDMKKKQLPEEEFTALAVAIRKKI